MASLYLTYKTQTMTMAEFRRSQVNKTQEQQAERVANGFIPYVTPEVDYSKVSNEKVLAMLEDSGVERLVKPTIADNLKKYPNLGQTYKTNLNFSGHRPDHQMARVAYDTLSKDRYPIYTSMMEAANKNFCTSGTPIGFLRRFCEGASKKNVKSYPNDVNLYLVQFLKDSFKLDTLPSFVDVNFADKFEAEDENKVDINFDANSGFPFLDSTAQSFEFHYKKASEFFLALKQGSESALRFMKENNWFTFYAMKNKRQIYAIEEIERKVRPYFVLPNAKKFLYLALAQPLCRAFKSFADEGFEETCSAYHFSWFDKGQDKLQTRLGRYREEEGKPDFICFGDDSYIFWWDQGKLHIVALDISMLDGSVRDNFEKPIINYLMDIYADKLDAVWKNILIMMSKEMFTQLVHVYNGEYVKRKGIPSGVPLTTVADMCVMGCYFGLLFRAVPSFAGMTQEKLDSVFESLCGATGLTVKPGTNVIHVIDQGGDYPSFLGMRPSFKTGYPIFENTEKLYASMFHPGDSINAKMSITAKSSITMSRCIGLTLCGGFHYLEVYDTLKAAFDSAYKAIKQQKENPIPYDVDYVLGCPVADVYGKIFEDVVMKGVFPELVWFRAFFTSEDPNIGAREKNKVKTEEHEVLARTLKKEEKAWGSITAEIEDTVASGEIAFITGLFDIPALNDKPVPKMKDRLPKEGVMIPVENYKLKPLPQPPKKKVVVPVVLAGKEEYVRETKTNNNNTSSTSTRSDRPYSREDYREVKTIIEKKFSNGVEIHMNNKTDKEFIKTLVGKVGPQVVKTLMDEVGYQTNRDTGGRVQSYTVPKQDSSDELEEL